MIRDPESFTALTNAVQRFVQEELRPLEAQVGEEDRIPAQVVQHMRELGLFGLSIPEQYDGLGLTMEEEALVVMELSKTSPAFRSVIGTTVGIGSQGILMDGTEEQKQRYLPRMASGELIASFALTEPEAGSDAASLKTSARKQGDHYIVNGTKRYITNAPHCSVFTLMARTNPQDASANGISAFIVDAKTPGISLGKTDKKMGQQGSHTCDVIFDDVKVPVANLIGLKEGAGFRTAMKVLDKGRIHIAAVCVGVAQRMLDDALSYALQRKQFKQPIAEFQLVQAMLADSQAELYAAQCMVLDAARLRDVGQDVTMQASCCKMFASEMCGRVADRAVQILGGAGYISDYGMERFYRDVRLFRLYEGTTQVQQLIIARNMIKRASR
jgi:acyl-CoA dehydrogenase